MLRSIRKYCPWPAQQEPAAAATNRLSSARHTCIHTVPACLSFETTQRGEHASQLAPHSRTPAPLAAIAASILLLKLVLPAALLGPFRACTLSAAYLWFSVSSGAAVGQEMRQGLTRTRMTRFVQGKHEDMLVNALRLLRHTISSCFSSHSRRG